MASQVRFLLGLTHHFLAFGGLKLGASSDYLIELCSVLLLAKVAFEVGLMWHLIFIVQGVRGVQGVRREERFIIEVVLLLKIHACGHYDQVGYHVAGMVRLMSRKSALCANVIFFLLVLKLVSDMESSHMHH